jgi:hypothetical protein
MMPWPPVLTHHYCPHCGRPYDYVTSYWKTGTPTTTAPLTWSKERIEEWVLGKNALRPEDV